MSPDWSVPFSYVGPAPISGDVVYEVSAVVAPTTEAKIEECNNKLKAMTDRGFVIEKIITIGYPSNNIFIFWRRSQ